MNSEQIFDVMRPIILAVTGVPECILANPNKPSPDGEYASVQPLQSITQRGQANIIRSNSVTPESIDVDVRAQIIAECSINFYRGDSRNRAQRLLQANKRPSVSAALFAAKLGWNKAGPINNLSALQSSDWESRAQISIFLMYETTDQETINSIEKIDYEVQDENADILATGEITST